MTARCRPTRQRWHQTIKTKQLLSWKRLMFNVCPQLTKVDRGNNKKRNLILRQWRLNSHLLLIWREADEHYKLFHGTLQSEGGSNVGTSVTYWGMSRQAVSSRLRQRQVIIRGLFLLIISCSTECGEKPAACGPERLFSYARPSWYGGRAMKPH